MFRFQCTVCLGSDSLSVHKWIRTGEKLMEEGSFRKAGIFFEKAFFQTEDSEWKARLLIKKSECLMADSSFADASRVLARISYAGLSDSTAVLARKKAALAAYMNADFSLAESHLLQAVSLIADSSLTCHLLPLYAMVLNEQRKWTEAKQILARYISCSVPAPDRLALLEKLSRVYSPESFPALKDPEKAKKFSTLLPGLGYFYAGAWQEGLWNVGLQGLGLGLTGAGIFYHYYFTSAFVSITIFQKFYSGGINRSVYHAKKWNYEKSREFNGRARDFILALMQKEKAP